MLPGVVCSNKQWKIREGFRWVCLKSGTVAVVPRTELSFKLVLEKSPNISLERCLTYCPTSCWTWILVGLGRTICHTLQPLECDDRDHCSPDWSIPPEQHLIISGLPSSGNKSKSPSWILSLSLILSTQPFGAWNRYAFLILEYLFLQMYQAFGLTYHAVL